MGKALVCACEDVSLHDVDDAVARGWGDIESLKRYTGLGTGPCQGKSCLVACMRHLAERLPPGARQPFTPRPPFAPTTLAALAGLSESAAPAPKTIMREASRPHPLQPATPLPERARVVIVGGGIMGLALAWGLARRGVTDVVVLERGYLLEGASGRNGGGVRMQWTTAPFIELARASIEFMKRFAQELGINVWLRQGGYLFTARDAAEARAAEKRAAFQRRHGVKTEILTPAEAQRVAPELDPTSLVAAAYHPDDGVIFPWPFLWGYADGARKLGARVETFTRVTAIDVEGGKVRGLQTDRGRITTDCVVVAAGAWSPEVARLAGVALPNEPHRHEILVTEPLKPFLEPLISELGSGLYFSQSMRGEIVGGMGDPAEPPGLDMSSTARFAARFARAATRLVPRLGGVKVVRQWAGCYDVTPDRSPILGETPGVAGLLQLNGFVGHGFMMAPAVCERMAHWMASGERDELFEKYALSRFAEGRLEREDMIIG